LAKRLTEKQKEEICKLFNSGINIDKLSKQFNCTKLTISRNLKKNFGEINYKNLFKKNKSRDKERSDINSKINLDTQKDTNDKNNREYFKVSEFVEITPLNYNIDNTPQKDFSSIPISEIDFPNKVFMIVDKKVELDVKCLKDYPEWQFLSKEELNRQTIEIYYDLKIAKDFCSKEQKVIKVPNAEVFKIVAPILRSRGISRIVSCGKLIAL